jgi:hypothetical protein
MRIAPNISHWTAAMTMALCRNHVRFSCCGIHCLAMPIKTHASIMGSGPNQGRRIPFVVGCGRRLR